MTLLNFSPSFHCARTRLEPSPDPVRLLMVHAALAAVSSICPVRRITHPGTEPLGGFITSNTKELQSDQRSGPLLVTQKQVSARVCFESHRAIVLIGLRVRLELWGETVILCWLFQRCVSINQHVVVHQQRRCHIRSNNKSLQTAECPENSPMYEVGFMGSCAHAASFFNTNSDPLKPTAFMQHKHLNVHS